MTAPQCSRRRQAGRALLLGSAALLLCWASSFTAFTSLLTGARAPAPARLGSASRQLSVARRQAADDAPMAVKKGDRVQVFYENVWYDCDVLEVSEDGSTCTAKYDDGGDEEGEIDIASRVREIPPPMKLEKGQRVELEFEGQWYDAEILDVAADGESCSAKYDEGGDEESDIEVRRRIREPRIKFADLEQGQKFKGTVVSVAPFGCFVDIGAERDGLVHISRMSESRIEDVYDVVSEGQEIDVWVSQVTDDGKLGLAMLESKINSGGGGRRAPADYSPFLEVGEDEWLTGTVAAIRPFGLFVTVTSPNGESTADGLVHIAQIRDGFVENPEDEAEVGQEVQVRVTNVDLDAGRMGLSMKQAGGFGGGGSRAPADLTPFEGVSSDEWLSGKVARTAPFGIFVTVTSADGESTADGLVHITQIRDGFVENTEDEVEVGQEVDVRVMSVDVGAGKMSLSMKQEDDGGY